MMTTVPHIIYANIPIRKKAGTPGFCIIFFIFLALCIKVCVYYKEEKFDFLFICIEKVSKLLNLYES